MALASGKYMGWICDHCAAPCDGLSYRVRSEESGVVLLDMIVCYCCYIEAQQLGLHTEEIRIPSFLNASTDVR